MKLFKVVITLRSGGQQWVKHIMAQDRMEAARHAFNTFDYSRIPHPEQLNGGFEIYANEQTQPVQISATEN